jgi:hypothetical protein
MNELDPITLWQDGGSQKRWPCGNNTACLMTASPDSLGQSHDFDRHTPPSPFVLSGSLRVQ